MVVRCCSDNDSCGGICRNDAKTIPKVEVVMILVLIVALATLFMEMLLVVTMLVMQIRVIALAIITVLVIQVMLGAMVTPFTDRHLVCRICFVFTC